MTPKEYIIPGNILLVRKEGLIFTFEPGGFLSGHREIDEYSTLEVLASPKKYQGINCVKIKTSISIGSNHGGPIERDMTGYIYYCHARYKTEPYEETSM